MSENNEKRGDLHAEIMNLRCTEPDHYEDAAVRMAYRVGHRDARHAAAELALAQHLQGEIPDAIKHCKTCHGEGWVCENHPDKAWNAAGCECGAGMPCECNLVTPLAQGLTDDGILDYAGFHGLISPKAKEREWSASFNAKVIAFARAIESRILAQAAPSASTQQAQPVANHCEHGSRCKWPGAQGWLAWGKPETRMSEWRKWHDEKCGGKILPLYAAPTPIASPAALTDGWKMVPAELTDEMMLALIGPNPRVIPARVGALEESNERYRKRYRDMLDAAPIPAKLADSDIARIYHEATGQHLRSQDERLAFAFARALLAASPADQGEDAQ